MPREAPPLPESPGRSPGLRLLFVLAASAALLLAFLGRRELCNPDEPRDAETAREASVGLWTVAPEINRVPFRERPPLYYWMVAVAFRAAGEPTDAAAKAASALLGVLAILAAWILGENLIGRGRGWLPALLLLGTPYFFLKMRVCVTDAGLVAFTALSLSLFFAAWRRDSWAWASAAGVAAGLAFLCKGLLGFGIPAVVAGAWLAGRRDFRAFLRLRLWLAVLAGLVVAGPWLWAVYRQQGPAWLRAFFVDQHLGRLGDGADHAKPFWTYVCILWAALPHTVPILAGLLPGRRRDAPGRDAFLAGALWVGSLLLVLSAIGGKRVIYLLPLLPGAALAAAGAVEAAAAGGLGRAGDLLVRVTVAVTGAFTLQFLLPRGRDLRARAGTAALGLAALSLGVDALVLPRFNRERSGHALAARAAAVAGDRPLVLFHVGEGHIGQFTFPLRRTLPNAWREPGLRRMMGDGPAVVLVENEVFEESKARGELSAGLLSSLRRIEEGVADEDRYTLYEWNGDREDVSPAGPPGAR